MSTASQREEHLALLRDTWSTMDYAELRTRVLGLVLVQFIMSEIESGGLSSDRAQRANDLLTHYATLAEVELREATSGLVAEYDALRSRVVASRNGDPIVFGLSRLEALTNDLCDAAVAALNNEASWPDMVAAQIERWVRTPPLGI
jgi:hypothetical protein